MSKKIKFNQKNFFGINPERVINKDYLNSLKDIIKCSLCNKIMINPTDCEECGHSFCYDCISTKECPFKCKEKKLKPSSMGIKTMLNKLIFKCENKGCNEEIPYLNVKAHDSTCDYLIITCPNEKCGKKLPMKDFEKHIKHECKYALKQCKYCKYQFTRNKIDEHEEICLKAYNSLKGDRSVDFDQIDPNQYLGVLSMNISRILRDSNTAKSFVGNENRNFNLNESEISKDNIVVNDDFKNQINEEIHTNVKSNFNNFEKNIENLNDNVSEIKTLVTSLKTVNENIVNESNKAISKIIDTEEKEKIKEIINGNYTFLENLLNKMEKNVKNSLKKLNINISKILNEPNISLTNIIKNINEDSIKKTNINIEEIEETKITNKIIKDGILYVPEDYFRNKLAYIIKLIQQTNENIDIFKLSFSSDIQEYTENLGKIISITATTEQIVTEIEIEEILDDEGNVIESREIEIKNNPTRQKSNRSLSFIHLNENNYKDLENNIQKIVDANNKKNFEQLKNMYEKELEQRKKDDEEYFVISDDEDDINEIIKNENIIDSKKLNKKGKRFKKIKRTYLTKENIFENTIEQNKEILNSGNEKIIEEVKNNNDNLKKEINNILSYNIDKVSNEMNGINNEIDTLKNNIKEIMTKMNEEFNDISKLIKENENDNELNKENKFTYEINENINKELKIDNIPINQKTNENKYIIKKRNYKLSKQSRELKDVPSNDEIIKNINEDLPDFEENSDDEKINKKQSTIITEKIIEEENDENKSNTNKPTKTIETIREEEKNEKINKTKLKEINKTRNIYINKEKEDNNYNTNKNNKEKEIILNENDSINHFSELLNSLQNELNSINSFTKKIPLNEKINTFKKSIIEEYDEKLPIFGKEIENELNNKMKSMFSLKWCNECEKVDYFYGFLPCHICNKDNCKDCIILCSQCKNFICKKCGLCEKCKKKICIKCRETLQKNSCNNCLNEEK